MVMAIITWLALVSLAYVIAEKQVLHAHHFNDIAVVLCGSLLHWILGASVIWVLLDLPLWTWGGYVAAHAFVILLLRIREPLTRKSLAKPKRVFFRHAEIDMMALALFHLVVLRFIV